MGALLILFTFSLGIIVSYVLFQYNSSKNTNTIHPSLLKLKEIENSSLKKDDNVKRTSHRPEFDINGELLPLYHNEEEYPISTNEIRKERTKDITNAMIQTVKEITNESASTDQIMFDLELTGDPQTTIDKYLNDGFLNMPPPNYYITPPMPESEEDSQSDHADEQENLPDNASNNEISPSNNGSSSGIYESIHSMYLNPQNLLEVYDVSLNKDYDSGKDSSMKMKAKSMILKARRNMEKLDQSSNLRK